MPTIEIEVTSCGEVIREHHYIGLSYLEKMCTETKDHLSGLLCAEHAQLPIVDKKLSDGRWIIEIKTCCDPMMDRIEKRMDENYEHLQKQ